MLPFPLHAAAKEMQNHPFLAARINKQLIETNDSRLCLFTAQQTPTLCTPSSAPHVMQTELEFCSHREIVSPRDLSSLSFPRSPSLQDFWALGDVFASPHLPPCFPNASWGPSGCDSMEIWVGEHQPQEDQGGTGRSGCRKSLLSPHWPKRGFLGMFFCQSMGRNSPWAHPRVLPQHPQPWSEGRQGGHPSLLFNLHSWPCCYFSLFPQHPYIL